MQYSPGTQPAVPEELKEAFARLWQELENVQRVLLEQDFVQLALMRTPPEKPRSGMVVYAEAGVWNPGGGTGFYGFHSGMWNKLG